MRRAAGGGGRGGGFDGAPLSRAARGAFSWFGSGTVLAASQRHTRFLGWGAAARSFGSFSRSTLAEISPLVSHTPSQDDTDSILLKTRGARVFCCCVGAPGGSGLPSLARVFGRVFPLFRGSFRSSLPGSWPLPPPPSCSTHPHMVRAYFFTFFCLSGSGRPLVSFSSPFVCVFSGALWGGCTLPNPAAAPPPPRRRRRDGDERADRGAPRGGVFVPARALRGFSVPLFVLVLFDPSPPPPPFPFSLFGSFPFPLPFPDRETSFSIASHTHTHTHALAEAPRPGRPGVFVPSHTPTTLFSTRGGGGGAGICGPQLAHPPPTHRESACFLHVRTSPPSPCLTGNVFGTGLARARVALFRGLNSIGALAVDPPPFPPLPPPRGARFPPPLCQPPRPAGFSALRPVCAACFVASP